MADDRPDDNDRAEDQEPQSRSAQERMLELSEMRQIKVRYERAYLTVARWGQVALSPVARVVGRWREGEASAEDVAWAFVHERIINATPSFDWERADLERLVRLVTEAADDPEIEARTVEALAPELDEIEKRERAQWEKARKAFTRNLNALTFDATKAFRVPSIAEQFSKTTFATTNWDKLFRQSLTQMTEMRNLQDIYWVPKLSELTNVPKMIEMYRPPKFSEMYGVPTPADLTGITKLHEDFFADLKSFAVTDAFRESLGDWAEEFDRLIDKEDLRGLADAFIRGANDFGQAEAAAAVQGAAEVAEDPEPADLYTAVEELAGQVKELTKAVHKTKDSAAKQIMIGLAILLIWSIIVIVFARYGIDLDPSQADEEGGRLPTTGQPKDQTTPKINGDTPKPRRP